MSKTNETVDVTLPQQKLDEIRKECEEAALIAFPDREWSIRYRSSTQLSFHNERIAFIKGMEAERIKREEERQAVEAILKFTAHKLTMPEAVKWLHDLYTEQCVTLQEVAQRHKLGLGGEKLAKVAADAIDRMQAERLRVEAMLEAGEELRRFLRKPIALSDEGVRHVHEQWDTALDQYRKNR